MPQSYRIIRIFLTVAVPMLWISGIFVLRKRKWLAISVFVAGLAISAFLCTPGSASNPDGLRKAYVKSLERYKGTLYIWGGENRIGIDCSGLIRKGLIHANIRAGLMTFNPQPIRQALTLWWYDCSARALRDGYKNFTSTLFEAQNINSIDTSLLLPGDLAVTANGVHILAFLGDNRWIEADPGVMRTIIVNTPADNMWFKMPVHVLRWTQLQDNSERN